MKPTIVALAFAALAFGQQPKATIQDVAWIAGHWQGQALGGLSDEYWAPPMAGSMMGMYRLVREEKIAFYEFFRIAEENGSLMIRLKHFHPDMKGWEEKEGMVEFPLQKISKDEAAFDGMIFKRTGPDTMTVTLTIGDKTTGKTRQVDFVYKRHSA